MQLRENNTPPPAQPTFQMLKVEDALTYLDDVKSTFKRNPQVYSDFLDIMRDFRKEHVDTLEVINKIRELFAAHPRLIYGFNTFLPAHYKILE